MHPLGARGSVGMPLGASPGSLGAASWWLSGGIAAANCVAAYTPKGAASLAASYDNNAAPGNGLADGTYDATPGVAPTFDTSVGWTLNGVNQWLLTGITDPANQSICLIVKFANVGLVGAENVLVGSIRSYLAPRYNANRIYQNGGTQRIIAGIVNDGTMAVSGIKPYLNGVYDGVDLLVSESSARPIYIGVFSTYYADGQISSFAVYNTPITAEQVAAVHAAMP